VQGRAPRGDFLLDDRHTAAGHVQNIYARTPAPRSIVLFQEFRNQAYDGQFSLVREALNSKTRVPFLQAALHGWRQRLSMSANRDEGTRAFFAAQK